MENLRILRFTAKNIRKGDDIDMEPGQFTVLEGENATGKSSHLVAIKGALSGNIARDATVRGGEVLEPAITMVLGNEHGEPVYRIEKEPAKVTVSKRVEGTQAFRAIARPQEFLTSLFDGLGVDPVRLSQLPQKELSAAILEAMPLELDRGKLDKILGSYCQLITGQAMLAKLHPLQELEACRIAIYDARTGVNRDAKQAFAAAEQLRLKLPPKIEEISGEQIKAVEAEKDALAAAVAADKEKARAECDAALKAASTDRDAELAKIKAYRESQAAFIRAKAEAEIAKNAEISDGEAKLVNTTFENERQDANTAFADALLVLAEREAAVSELKAHVAGLHEKAKTSEAQNALQRQAVEFDAKAEAEKAKSEQLSGVIDLIEEMKMQLASSLPIKGLAISPAGDIALNGVPLEQLNTEARTDLFIRIGVLRAKGPLKLIVIDNTEALDSKHWAAVRKRLAKENVQVIAGRVTDAPGLNIEKTEWA